jgi:hypothetical protein
LKDNAMHARLLAATLLLVGLATVADDWNPQNLAVNPGFEEAGGNGLPVQWRGDTTIYSRDTSVKRSGEASLKFVNADPEKYRLCVQSVPFEVGAKYEFSVWVKTEGVEGSEAGASICVEFADGDGKYVTGTYPAGVQGTSDWTQVKTLSKRVPENVASGTVVCYLRRSMTGTAWWDDLEVKRHRGDPLTIKVVSPNYRNEITDAGPAKVRVRAEVDLFDHLQAIADVALAWRITPEHTAEAVASGTADVSEDAATEILLPGKELKPGKYMIEVELKEKSTGDVLSTRTCKVTRLTETPRRTVFIDSHNRLICDGKPFFPLGMYWGTPDAEQLDIYADSAFNCLMPYNPLDKARMDLIHARGLKTFYSVKDCYTFLKSCPKAIETEDDELTFIRNKVETFRDHPALLAWYLNDEAPLTHLDRLVAHREWLEELDPNHPTWAVLYQIGDIGGYFPTCHAIGTDPYPVSTRPAAMAGEWARKTVNAMHGARPVWMVPQVFNWAAYKKTEKEKAENRQPTMEEVRSMTWQCLAEGANGLIYYSWFNLYFPHRNVGLDFDAYWAEFKEVVQEVEDMIPALLSIEEPPDIGTANADWLNWTAKRVGKTTYLIAVNNAPEPHSATFAMPQKATSAKEAGTGEELALEEGKALRLDFSPLGVRLIEMAGLPDNRTQPSPASPTPQTRVPIVRINVNAGMDPVSSFQE